MQVNLLYLQFILYMYKYMWCDGALYFMCHVNVPPYTCRLYRMLYMFKL